MSREQSLRGSRTADRVLAGSFCVVLFVCAIGALISPESPATDTVVSSSDGTTAYYPKTESWAPASPSAAYSAPPADLVPKGRDGSLFNQLPAVPAPTSKGERRDAVVVGQRYITGHKVPLRAAPEVGSAILDRLSPGQVVGLIEEGRAWARIRDELTQREGWVPSKRLTAEKPANENKADRREITPMLSVAAIAKLLIAESIARYPGPCACPYQSTGNGSSCGQRAAYSRPGGYAPLCYAHDVTSAMIAGYRESQTSAVASR